MSALVGLLSLRRKWLTVNLHQFVWLYAFLNMALFAQPFLSQVYTRSNNTTLLLVGAAMVFCYFTFLFGILFSGWTAKPLAVILLPVNAAALYFVNTYKVYINDDMIINVLQTDGREVAELITPRLIAYILALGVLPALLVLKTGIRREKFLRRTLLRLLNILGALLLFLAVVFAGYKSVSSFGRANKELQFLLIPTNYITSLADLGIKALKHGYLQPTEKQPIAVDAQIDRAFYDGMTKKNLLILVVGEAARAESFSLNGYERDTNAPLQPYDLVNFSNFHSCGTATAVSVPCMFSHFARTDFSVDKEKGYYNVTDVLAAQGFDVSWRDNNSGCKGVCERVPTEIFFSRTTGPYCQGGECFDEALLQGLTQRIASSAAQNIVVILHQKGSHGPAYYKRAPKEMQKFQPVCASELFEQCTAEQLVNSYDNSIYYTSYFLARVIELLKGESGYNSAMIYMSDHGQSLGEHGMYLHGAPYFIAPSQQTHIPALLWMSDDFAAAFGIDRDCLKGRAAAALSHDYLFHSLLGLFRISTKAYDPQLDLFRACT